jgi:hypothetical protein
MLHIITPSSDHQQNWGYEDGPWKGPGSPLLVAADFHSLRLRLEEWNIPSFHVARQENGCKKQCDFNK